MYKVFLVEDEDQVRRSIRENVPWMDAGCVCVGEASDGEMALSMIQELRPDILFTDIKMPFIDGLQLARLAKHNLPNVKIILISGYDDFEYVREGMKLGAVEYLLKPLRAKPIIEVLKKTVNSIEQERRQLRDINVLRQRLRKSTPLLKERFLNQLIIGGIDTTEILAQAERYKLHLLSKHFIALKLQFFFTEEMEPENIYIECMKMQSIVDDLANHYDQSVITFNKTFNEIVFLLKGNEKDELKDFAYSYAQSLKHELDNQTECTYSIGIGTVVSRLSDIVQSFMETERAMRYDKVFGRNIILGFDDIVTIDSKKRKFTKIKTQEFLDLLHFAGRDQIYDYIEGQITAQLNSSAVPFYYFHYLIMDIILTIDEAFSDIGYHMIDFNDETMGELLLGISDQEEFYRKIKPIICDALEYRDSRKNQKHSEVILRAKLNIENNFQEENFTLIAVAADAGLSASHFSTVFSQETGLTFIEYVTELRVRKAKEFLKTTSMRSSEIAYKIGYNDASYFCHVFKKMTGLTPTEYRVKNENGDDEE